MKKIYLLLFFTLFIFSCNNPKDIQVLDVKFDPPFQDYLDISAVEYEYTDNILSIRNSRENLVPLVNVLNILEKKKAVVQNNIANINTTRTETGRCFLRQELVVDSEGNIEVLTDTRSQTMLVYDPTHPDAIHEEKLRGYVEYPNINRIFETVDLITINREIDTIVVIIQEIDPSLLIRKEDFQKLWEAIGYIEHFSRF